MTRREKVWLYFGLGMTLLVFVLLSMGLSQLELRGGNFLSGEARAELAAVFSQFGRFKYLFLFLAIVGVVVAIVSFRSRRYVPDFDPPKRRSLLSSLIQILLFVLVVILLRRRLAENNLNLNPSAIEQMPSLGLGDPNIAVIESNIPDWFVFGFSLFLFVVVGLFGWRLWHNRRRSEETLDLLAREARSAVEALRSGGDIRNVIIRCYFEMVQVLNRQRGITRKEGMTPREFERRLFELGLPVEPVTKLTRLFESVRYGAKDLGEVEERQALAYLEAIVQASGGRS